MNYKLKTMKSLIKIKEKQIGTTILLTIKKSKKRKEKKRNLQELDQQLINRSQLT